MCLCWHKWEFVEMGYEEDIYRCSKCGKISKVKNYTPKTI